MKIANIVIAFVLLAGFAFAPSTAQASRIVAMSFCEPRSWTRVLSS